MKRLSILASLAFTFSLFSQEIDFNKYEALICKGTVPGDFSQKQLKPSINSDIVSHAKQYDATTYALTTILNNGRLLYGDHLTSYVNKVADSALKSDPELRKQLRFYVLRNSEVNAQCLDRGIIFINMGLLAQLENEAQLALIICHEASHYKLKHHFDYNDKQEELITGKAKSLNNDVKYTFLTAYKVELEYDADKSGLSLFLKSPYNPKGIERVFDILKYGYLPFDDLKFKRQFLSDKLYNFPSKYLLNVTKAINTNPGEQYAITHPQIGTRKALIVRTLAAENANGTLNFIESEKAFEIIRKMARYEVSIIQMQDGNYEEAFYLGYLIEKLYGRSIFSDKIIGAALYNLAKKKTSVYAVVKEKSESSKSKIVNTKFKKWELIEGESQSVHFLFDEIPPVELSVLAAKKLFEMNKQNHEPFFKKRFDNLMFDLFYTYKLNIADIAADTVSTNSGGSGSIDSLSKYDKIRQSEKLKINSYYNYAFSDFKNDAEFKSRSEELRDSMVKRKSDLQYELYLKERYKIIHKYGLALGVDKAYFITPGFTSYNHRYVEADTFYYIFKIRDRKIGPVKEIEIENTLLSNITKYANQVSLKYELPGQLSLQINDTDSFNRYQSLINWSNEQFSDINAGIMPFNQAIITDISNEVGSICFFRLVKEYSVTTLQFLCLDLKTGKVQGYYFKELKKVDPEGAQIRTLLYDIIDHVKQTPDKINALKLKYGINE